MSSVWGRFAIKGYDALKKAGHENLMWGRFAIKCYDALKKEGCEDLASEQYRGKDIIKETYS